jgi:hypothetical protein
MRLCRCRCRCLCRCLRLWFCSSCCHPEGDLLLSFFAKPPILAMSLRLPLRSSAFRLCCCLALPLLTQTQPCYCSSSLTVLLQPPQRDRHFEK